MHTWLQTTGVRGRCVRFPLDGEPLRLGSSGTMDIWIPLPEVARLHCRLVPDGAHWTAAPVADADVSIDGRRLDGPRALAPGQCLGIGRVSLLLCEGEAAVEERPMASIEILPGRRDHAAIG